MGDQVTARKLANLLGVSELANMVAFSGWRTVITQFLGRHLNMTRLSVAIAPE
jgi:hypothetical protein